VAHALAASGRLEDAVALLAEAARGALEAFDALRVEHLLDGCGHILDSVIGGPERERIPLGQRLEIDLLRARLCLEQGRTRDALKQLDAVTPRLRAMPGESGRLAMTTTTCAGQRSWRQAAAKLAMLLPWPEIRIASFVARCCI
jgi:hypothetical protein